MNATKALICILTAGVALGAAAPVFADWEHDRGHAHERGRNSYYDRHDHRANYRGYYRDYYGPGAVVVRRPYVVGQPVYYPGPVYYPAPLANVGVGAIIGATIGGLIDNRY